MKEFENDLQAIVMSPLSQMSSGLVHDIMLSEVLHVSGISVDSCELLIWS